MKSVMIAVLVAGLTLVSGVSAMTVTGDAMIKKDGAMMKDDKMMAGDAMMKKDGAMMKDDKMMAKKSTALIAASMGYSWSKDRTTLATKAGITGYRGTKAQNLAIRSHLMGMMKDKMMMADDKMMKGDTMAK